MLSRVADNLYWMSRYLERVEHTARLIDVNLDLMPDRSHEDILRGWQKMFASLRMAVPKEAPLDAYQIFKALSLDSSNDGSIIANIAAARENARQVREQISSEMWEQINRLYLDVKNSNIEKIWHTQPHEFFQVVKQGAQLFHGICNATMNRGEGWYFIQVGQSIERASSIATLLNVHLEISEQNDQSDNGADRYLEWVGLLRSCTAFEAYCKVYTADLRFKEIAEFLLLNEEFPHSVNFSVTLLRLALDAIADTTGVRKNSQIYRRIGRLKAALDFDQIDEVISGDLHGYLYNIQMECAQIHTLLYQTYINYPVDEKIAS